MNAPAPPAKADAARPGFGRRPNPVFTEAYRTLREAVTEARRRAGLSQRALAQRIGKCPSHITMIERGQRRIDTLELFRIAVALEIDPAKFFEQLAGRLAYAEEQAKTEPPAEGKSA